MPRRFKVSVSNTGGGGINEINIGFMRDNRPNRANSQGIPPGIPANYIAPVPEGDLGNYYAASVLPQNETGWAHNRIGREGDPTAHTAATGSQSIILGSKNINFTLPILAWTGRSGLGVQLVLSYNSTAWLNDPFSGKLAFNSDRGFPAPGWRLGFGQLQGGTPLPGTDWVPPFWNQQVGKYTYIWVEPDGTRRALIGGTTYETDIYVSNDSSRIEYNKQNGRMRFPDGTQMWFTTPKNSSGEAISNEMLPEHIQDRNGNFLLITIEDIGSGRWAMRKITDTLGRQVDFLYENGLLTEIGQQRSAEWRSFVKFHYTPITLQTIFSGVTPDPPNINGQQVLEPWFVEFPNQVNYRFFYTSYCQVYEMEKWVPTIDGQGQERTVAYTWYDLPSVDGVFQPVGPIKPPANNNTPQTGCPKFATRSDWAESMNVNVNQELTHVYSELMNPDGSIGGKVVDPLGRVYRTDVSSDGFTHTSRVWQDETSYGSDASPEVALKTETTVYVSFTDGPVPTSVTTSDEKNAKRIEFSYTNVGGATLPAVISEYSENGVTPYRRREIAYNSDPAYSSRFIFGLPSLVSIYRGNEIGTPISSTAFSYDEPDCFDAAAFNALQHDSTNYGGYFIGRANPTTVTQNELPGTGSRAVTRIRYNKAGQPTEVTDAAGNISRFFFEDNFLAGQVVPETHGLVTRVQDADGYWTGTRYDWHNALPTERYHIAGTTGAGVAENLVTYAYDFADRPEFITRPDGGRTTYEYWDNWLSIAEYTDIDATNRVYRYTAKNGLGLLRWRSGDHADGTGDKFWTERVEYDAAGRAASSSNITTVDAAGNPAGDDDPAQGGQGFLYTDIGYDSLDRQILITRPDDNTVSYNYEGCGCAGGWTLTTTDERGKQRRQLFDFLSRLCKAQELDVTNPAAPVIYSQARYVYDERDLILRIEHSGGNEAQHQDRTFDYDGFGRLWRETTPEKGLVEYTHTPNDLIGTVADARGVVVTRQYNRRGLVTAVLYSDDTPDAYYDYGEYGERLWMEERNAQALVVGRTDYGYDQYRRLRSETRTFPELPLSLKVDYDYNYAKLLTKLSCTIPGWSSEINYVYGLGGSLKSVGTNLVAGDALTNVASGMLYKAYGALREVAYGNGQQLGAEYSFERHQLTGLSVMKQGGQDAVYDLVFDYYAAGGNNGRLQHVDDNSLTAPLAIDFTYDHYNRLVDASASSYRRSYTFDAWGNLRGLVATGEGIAGYGLDYELDGNQVPISNRVSNAGYGYDAAGNLTSNGLDTFTYDGASRQRTGRNLTVNEYDGDGNRIKHSNSVGTLRYLWSSVLGEAVLEHDVNLGAYRQYVYTPGGALIALRSYDSQFYWVHEDHLGSGRRLTNQAGTLVHQMELDPHGTIVRESPPNNYLNSHKFTGYERDWSTETDNAKARTYDPRIARFLQPDPLGVAAADLTGPQSLNRYSYVENDPVNNVDPLGLMTCFGYHAYSVLVDSETGAVIGETYLGFMPQYCWDEQTGGTVGGGGGGGPATVQPTCYEFVDSLVKIVSDGFSQRLTLPTRAGGASNSLLMNSIGVGMLQRAIANVDVHGSTYVKKLEGNSGFKPDLVALGQGGDVYHHIEFVAGTYFLGLAGRALHSAFDKRDRDQVREGRLESYTEVRDNAAGQTVGKAMLSAYMNGNLGGLRAQLRSVLCQSQ